jgi:hypothetical protein
MPSYSPWGPVQDEAAIAKTDAQIKEEMAAIVREWNPEYFEARKPETLEIRAA